MSPVAWLLLPEHAFQMWQSKAGTSVDIMPQQSHSGVLWGEGPQLSPHCVAALVTFWDPQDPPVLCQVQPPGVASALLG